MALNRDKTLRVRWKKKEKDWVIDYPTKSTGWLMHHFLQGGIDFNELAKELKERGYDTETFKMHINKREFRCIKPYTNEGKVRFVENEVYFMSQDSGEVVGFLNKDGYTYFFSKNKEESEKEFFGDYFEEKL